MNTSSSGRALWLIKTIHLDLFYLLLPSNKHTMAFIRPPFFILGLIVALVTAQNFTTQLNNSSSSTSPNNETTSTAATPTMNVTSNTIISNISTSTMNFTTTNSSTLTPTPTMTGTEGGETTQDGKTSSPEMPTPKPGYTDKSPTPTMEDNNKDKGKTTDEKKNDSTGIVILIIIIIIVLGFGVVCFFARKRGRRYSVDFTSRPDDANIPLSIVDPELPINTVPQNGLQTFESVESTKEPQEPETKPEAQEEQKVDPDKSVVEPAAESAAPAPAPDSPEDKPKEEGVETTPPAPVEPSVDEKTDDEGVVSNKTSVESLKETNENNSNSADFRQKPDLMSSNSFCDVPLDCPV